MPLRLPPLVLCAACTLAPNGLAQTAAPTAGEGGTLAASTLDAVAVKGRQGF